MIFRPTRRAGFNPTLFARATKMYPLTTKFHVLSNLSSLFPALATSPRRLGNSNKMNDHASNAKNVSTAESWFFSRLGIRANAHGALDSRLEHRCNAQRAELFHLSLTLVVNSLPPSYHNFHLWKSNFSSRRASLSLEMSKRRIGC